MKALHFAKPLEFRLETLAEEHNQGDVVSGSVSVTNRGSTAVSGVDLCVFLAYAEFKTLKESPAEAFEMVDETVPAEELTLAAGATLKRDWTFTLPVDCPITTKGGSLFLRYGTRQDGEISVGTIDLRVGLVPALEVFAASLENHFGFEARTRKNSDGFTEINYKAPSSYPTLTELNLHLRQTETEVEVQFRCKLKGLSRGQAGGVRNRFETWERSLPVSKFFLSGALPNRALYRDFLGEVLEEITPAVLRK